MSTLTDELEEVERDMERRAQRFRRTPFREMWTARKASINRAIAELNRQEIEIADRYREHVADLEVKNDEIARLAYSYQVQRAELNRQEQEIARLQDNWNTMTELRRIEIARLTSELAEAKAELAERDTSDDEQYDAYLANVEALRAELVEARAALKAMAESPTNVENERLRRELAEARKIRDDVCTALDPEHVGLRFDAMADKAKALHAGLAEARKLYDELLYGVANKHPEESRHETAKRYIYNAENQTHGPDAAIEHKEP